MAIKYHTSPFSLSPHPLPGGEENGKVKVNLVGWDKNDLITGEKKYNNNNNSLIIWRGRESNSTQEEQVMCNKIAHHLLVAAQPIPQK